MSFDVYLGKGSFNITHNVNQIVDRCLVAAGAVCAKPSDGWKLPCSPQEAGAMRTALALSKRETSYGDYSWGRLEGWKGRELVSVVEAAIRVADDPTRLYEFKELEPSNGWGTLDSVKECLRDLLAMCKDNSDDEVRVSG